MTGYSPAAWSAHQTMLRRLILKGDFVAAAALGNEMNVRMADPNATTSDRHHYFINGALFVLEILAGRAHG